MSGLSEDDIALAAEYTLNLLDRAQHAQAAARVSSDAAFAAEVVSWQERLHPLLDGQEQAAPESVWTAISAQIAPPANENVRSSGLRLWQGLTLLSTGVAAALALMLISRPDVAPVQTTTPLIAALGSETGPSAMTASYEAASGKLVLTPVSLKTGKLYPELWVIPEGGTAHSLGVIRGDGPMQIIVTPELRAHLAKGSTLAITTEPLGGAPGGKATGPIIASGKITTI